MIALFQVDSHNGWIKDIIAYNNLSTGFSYPIIADPKREVSMKILYGQFTIELTAPTWVPIWGPGSPWGPFSVFGSPKGPHFLSKVPIFPFSG